MAENQGYKKCRKVIDLFAGCGGLSLGLYQAGGEGLCSQLVMIDATETLNNSVFMDE